MIGFVALFFGFIFSPGGEISQNICLVGAIICLYLGGISNKLEQLKDINLKLK